MASRDADRDDDAGRRRCRRAGRHGLDPRRRVHHGVGRLLSGGAPRAQGRRGRLLDGHQAGHGSRLPPVCDRDGLPDGRRAAAQHRRLPGCRPRPAGTGLAGLPPHRRAGRSPRLPPVVDVRSRRVLAASRGPGQPRPAPGPAPGHARCVCRRGGLRGVGGQVAADRGAVGVRRPRRPRRRCLRVGRRLHTRRQAPGEHLAGRVPVAEPGAGRLRGHLAGRRVPAQRVRPVRRGRQRVGVDERLLPAPPRGRRHRSDAAVLRAGAAQPGCRGAGPRPGVSDPAPGDQGRLAPVRAELLPALPARGPPGRGRRHVDGTPRLPLRHPVGPVISHAAGGGGRAA